MSQWLFGKGNFRQDTAKASRSRRKILPRYLKEGLIAEVLEVRALPSVSFVPTTGLLTAIGDEQGPTNDSISVSAAGKFVEVNINGSIHSSDPSSVNYDSALDHATVGATGTSVKSILIQGLNGDDTLTVNDEFHAANHHITLEGGAGNDLLIGNMSSESLNGGAGDDMIIPNADPSFTGVLPNDTLDGGDGSDWVDFSGSLNGVWGKLNGKFVSTEGIDRVRNIENVIGSAFGDKITGDTKANILIGGPGDDTINGNGGNDSIDGGIGNDILSDTKAGNCSISGGYGDDSLSGANGNDILDGGPGNDTILGKHGNDTLIGGDGNDKLTGTNGNFLLTGGNGDDTLLGGTGNDTLDAGSGNDSLNGGAGTNIVDADQGDDVIAGAKEFEQVLTGTKEPTGHTETGFAEYITDTKDSTSLQREFEFVLTGVNPNSTYDVTIDGVVVGQIMTDPNGADQLVFATDPDSSEEAAFPGNFPEIHKGSTISVKNDVSDVIILQGVFVPDSTTV